MKKLINEPGDVVREMLEGLVLGNRDLALLADETVVVRADIESHRRSGRVSLISGGGSGHEPAHAGYVGEGLLTATVAGDVFTSPSVDTVLAALRAVAGDAGTLLIVKNYTGDRLNFGLAAEIARTEGLRVEMVIVDDDVALSDHASIAGRRGIAGTVLVHKIAGAAAAAGQSLADVKREAEQAIASLGTMGVALGPCTVPAAGVPGFNLGDDEIELGLGIHGEPGVRRARMQPANVLVEQVIERILAVKQMGSGARVVLLVNNLGGSPPMELAIITRAALKLLVARGVVVERVLTGTFLTAIEMPGFSITLLVVDDRRLERLCTSTRAIAWAEPRLPNLEPAFVPARRPAAARNLRDEADESDSSGSAANHAAELRNAIERVARSLIESESLLTRLDSVVGDGDLGISLSRGANAVLSELDRYDLQRPARSLRQISETLRRVLGGTSGPLYSAFLLRLSSQLPSTSWPSLLEWATAFEAGCDALSNLGGAKPGDRTMLDALVPAAQALRQGAHTGLSGMAALRNALQAAADGCEATKAIPARRGRSSYLGERALGHPDPGAHAVTVWLGALQAPQGLDQSKDL
jgi:triose/dihydroxyacetone kinase / FAD-AMP lyase (cyclizing)